MKTKNKIRLYTPGPTQVPPKIQQCMSDYLVHHRSLAFQQNILKLLKNFKHLLGKNSETVVFTASGSGAMEAAVASLFKSNDTVLIAHAGKFGNRWCDIAKTYELNITELQCPWGLALDAQHVVETAKKIGAKAIFIQACETSSGVFHPIFEVAKALVDSEILCIVDAITAFGIYPFNLEAQGIDVLISASQKGLMCPPGVASVSLSSKAQARLLTHSRSHYFSIQKELISQRDGNTVFTPNIPLFFALKESTDMILLESMPRIFERHQYLQNICRQYFKLQGLTLLSSDKYAALGLTAVCVDNHFDVSVFLEKLKNIEGVYLASGQGHLKEKIFRLAHMGYCYPEDLAYVLRKVDNQLSQYGFYKKDVLPSLLNDLQTSKYKNPHV